MTHAPAAEAKTPPPPRQMKVLALGLPRTGTLSMAEALTMLGYANVHHTLKSGCYRDEDLLRFYRRAADGGFPKLATYTGRPLTRAECDAAFGGCEAVTELAALLAPQLIAAYPEAKVVVVVRDFERWFGSVDAMILGGLWSGLGAVFVRFVEPVLGLSTISTLRKLTLAFFEADGVAEARRNARAAYDGHHARIRALVPPDRLLLYRLGDGWPPLCRFLGRPVPDAEFPRVNDGDALRAAGLRYFLVAFRAACWLVLTRVLAAAAAGLLLWTVAARLLRA